MSVLTCKEYTGHDVDTRVYDSRGGADIALLILHHTGSSNEHGDAEWLSTYHTNPVSCHQLVLRDGDLVQIVPNEGRAWHAGQSAWGEWEDLNTTSVGIEICNKGDGTEFYTMQQKQIVAATVAYNCARYKVRDENVVSHAQVRAEWIRRHGRAPAKNDPLHWDWGDMWARVAAIRASWPWHDILMWACMLP